MNSSFRIGEFLIEPEIYCIARNRTSTRVEPKMMQVLICLAESATKVVSREQLIQSVWADTFVTDEVLTRSISELRKVFEDDAKEPRFIQTIPRSGYRLVAPISYELGVERKDIPALVASNWRKRFFWAAGILSVAFLLAVASWNWSWLKKGPALATMRVIPFTTEGGNHDAAAFSPDGNQIALRWGGEKNDNIDIYVKSIGGETPFRLTTRPGPDFSPSWSPDGQTIAFVRNWENGWSIFTVPALGGTERKFLSLGSTDWDLWPGLDWSPDGKFIASSYKSSKEEPAGILLFSIETGEKRILTSLPALSLGDSFPVFSPDSQTLAFVRLTSRGTGLGDLYSLPITGGEPKRLTSDSAHIDRAAWTPDGREIIFSSSRLASAITHSFLWRIPALGGPPERVAVGRDRAFSVAVSGRGHRLAYTHWGGKLSIYRLALPVSTGQPAVPVGFVSSTEGDLGPQFSQDGRRVAFSSDRSGNSEIWTCNSDGSNPSQLTFLGHWAGAPRWSPDGRQIAFDVNENGDWNIYTASAEGGVPRRLTTDAADDNIPSWSRDGQWIYFTSKRSGDSQIWKTTSDGGVAVQVTRHGGFVAFESPDGKNVYYTKDGANGIWQTPVEGGEETLVLDSFYSGWWGNWAVVSDGIYFIYSETRDDVSLEFFSFATHRITTITKIGLKREMVAGVGLAVSPDRRSILFGRAEGYGAGSLMLVENFR
jgi:Tol biopolymer transport system component/DNA-binding winged helix-turn-helix (wHTH) protein